MKTTMGRRLRGRAALAVGSAVAVGAGLALTTTGAQSALAAAGAAAGPAALSAQSYRVSMITTETFTAQSGGGHIVDMATKGAFNPARHAGAETLPVNPEIPAITAIRYIGGYAYLYFPVPEPGPLGTNGLHWLKATADAPSGNFVDNLPTDAVEGLVTPGAPIDGAAVADHAAPRRAGTRPGLDRHPVHVHRQRRRTGLGAPGGDPRQRDRGPARTGTPAAGARGRAGILRVGNRHQDPHDQPDLQRLRGPRTGPGTASQPGLQPRARHGLHSPLRSSGTTPGITSPGSGRRMIPRARRRMNRHGAA